MQVYLDVVTVYEGNGRPGGVVGADSRVRGVVRQLRTNKIVRKALRTHPSADLHLAYEDARAVTDSSMELIER